MIDPAHLTDAELAAWYGSGLHREKAGRLIEEVRRLRARLAEVEARLVEASVLTVDFSWRNELLAIVRGGGRPMNTDTIRCMIREKRTVVDLVPDLRDEIDSLRARLAEVEADSDRQSREINVWHTEAQRLAARLAEVEAERATAWDDGYAYGARGRSDPPEFDQNPYRAAARGEGDRPAACSCPAMTVVQPHERCTAHGRPADCEYCGGLDGAHRPTCRRFRGRT